MNHIEVVRTLVQVKERDLPKPATTGQITALQILFRRFTTHREERLKWVSDLFGYGIDTFSHLTITQACQLLDYAYPDCMVGELPPDPKFMALIEQLKTYKEKEVLIETFTF